MFDELKTGRKRYDHSNTVPRYNYHMETGGASPLMVSYEDRDKRPIIHIVIASMYGIAGRIQS